MQKSAAKNFQSTWYNLGSKSIKCIYIVKTPKQKITRKCNFGFLLGYYCFHLAIEILRHQIKVITHYMAKTNNQYTIYSHLHYASYVTNLHYFHITNLCALYRCHDIYAYGNHFQKKTVVQKHLNCTLCEGNSFEMKNRNVLLKGILLSNIKRKCAFLQFHSFFVFGHAFLFQLSYT